MSRAIDPRAGRLSKPGRLGRAALAVAAAAASTAAQAVAAGMNIRWYGGLLKPAFSPSPWFAAAVATALAFCLAGALFRVLCSPDYLPDRPVAIRTFAFGLCLNVLWTWLFFAGRHPTTALAGAALLTAVAALSAWRCAVVDRRAGLLLVPWVLAAGFAFMLALSIALRNG